MVDGDDPAGASGPPVEHDLLVVLKLSNRHMGTAQERLELEQFADRLAEAVEAAGAGEYDGDELGGGACTLFFAGPDADRLHAVLKPLLRHHPLARGGEVVKSYGDGAEPQRIAL